MKNERQVIEIKRGKEASLDIINGSGAIKQNKEISLNDVAMVDIYSHKGD
jgi:hypothetical protein